MHYFYWELYPLTPNLPTPGKTSCGRLRPTPSVCRLLFASVTAKIGIEIRHTRRPHSYCYREIMLRLLWLVGLHLGGWSTTPGWFYWALRPSRSLCLRFRHCRHDGPSRRAVPVSLN